MQTITITMNMSERYQKEIMPKLATELKFDNVHRVPRIQKIVINMGLGQEMDDKKVFEVMGQQLGLITGQKPLITKARRAIAVFKLRAGAAIGLKVTLRGRRMWAFLEKLIGIVFPRVRDFRGVSANGFDRDGNLSLGFTEITVFPEINYETLDKVRGLEVTIVTTAQTKEEGKALLAALGMPFEKTN